MNTNQPTPPPAQPPDKPQGAEPHFITVYSGTGTFAVLSNDKQVEIPIGDERTTNEIRDELNEYITKQLTSARNSIIACKAMLQVDAAELTAATEALEKAKAELGDLKSQYEMHVMVPLEKHDALEQSGKREAALREALARIAKWHGEFPATVFVHEKPMSYGAAYGSNGERDYMREIARAALSQQAPTNSTTGSTPQG
jgi:hypothetical protein